MNAATNVPGARAGSAQIGMVAAVSIGIGGMVGAGIFSILGVVAVVLLTLVNAFGARLMGRWETVIVAVKLAILVLFAAVGLWFIRPGYLSPELWPESTSILFGAGVLFIGYEGFGLVTNAAADMRDPRRLLPRALYTSVLIVIVIYLAVALTVTRTLSDCE